MISALLVSTLLGAAPDLGSAIQGVRRAFLEDGEDRVSATATHRVVSHADGSLELQGAQSLRISLQSVRRELGPPCRTGPLSREIVPAMPRTVRTLRACDLEETWTNQPTGLEQSFTLQRAPAGKGGLRLRLAVEGPWHHHDAEGHVFGGPGLVDRLRYGNAFVVREGRRLPIPVVRVEGGLELRVPAALVEAPDAFPMLIDPVLAQERAISPNRSFVPLSTQEQEPALAIDPTGRALVAWTDNRRQVQTDIFAARFDLNGLQDQTGIPVSTEPGHQRHPAVAWNGTAFVVAWEQEQLDGGVVKASTLTSSGTFAAGVRLVDGTQPVLAGVSDGGYALLGWVDGAAQAKAAKLTGTTLAAPFLSPGFAEPGRAHRPAIAATGNGGFLIWEHTPLNQEASSIKGHWLSAMTPTVVDVSNPDAGDARRPTVALLNAAVEENLLAFWEEGAGRVSGRLMGAQPASYTFLGSSPAVVRRSELVGTGSALLATVDLLGNLQFRDPEIATPLVSYGSPGGRPAELALAVAGSTVAGVWSQGGLSRDIWGATLTLPISNGRLSVVQASLAAANQLRPHVALQDSEGLAVWLDAVNALSCARVTLSADGASFGSPMPLVSAAQEIQQGDLAAGPPDLYLVVWRQADLIGSAVVAQLANRNGPVGGLIPLSSQAVAGPTVAWDAHQQVFVVAWVDQPLLSRVVVSTTVSPAGVAVLPAVLRGTEKATDVDLTCLASGQCLLAWDAPVLGQVKAAVLDSNSPPVTISAATQPAVTHDGTSFFLGWRSASGLSFASVDATTGVLSAPIPELTVPVPTGRRQVDLSLAPGVPPLASWAELSANEESTVWLQHLGRPPLQLAGGQHPIVATSASVAQGVVVYQRYADAADLRAMRAWGWGFFLDVDAGVPPVGPDAGIDAGTPDAGPADGGVDAGEPSDAGVLSFGTSGCGCHSSSVAPLVLLALAALRRRRGR